MYTKMKLTSLSQCNDDNNDVLFSICLQYQLDKQTIQLCYWALENGFMLAADGNTIHHVYIHIWIRVGGKCLPVVLVDKYIT